MTEVTIRDAAHLAEMLRDTTAVKVVDLGDTAIIFTDREEYREWLDQDWPADQAATGEGDQAATGEG